jgi:hypothetical protein
MLSSGNAAYEFLDGYQLRTSHNDKDFCGRMDVKATSTMANTGKTSLYVVRPLYLTLELQKFRLSFSVYRTVWYCNFKKEKVAMTTWYYTREKAICGDHRLTTASEMRGRGRRHVPGPVRGLPLVSVCTVA